MLCYILTVSLITVDILSIWFIVLSIRCSVLPTKSSLKGKHINAFHPVYCIHNGWIISDSCKRVSPWAYLAGQTKWTLSFDEWAHLFTLDHLSTNLTFKWVQFDFTSWKVNIVGRFCKVMCQRSGCRTECVCTWVSDSVPRYTFFNISICWNCAIYHTDRPKLSLCTGCPKKGVLKLF